jgi:hypothetical protein
VSSVEELRGRILSYADPNLCLFVDLTGLKPLNLILDCGTLARELSQQFFSLQLSDSSVSKISEEEIREFQGTAVIGEFVRRMRLQIEQSNDDRERRIAETSLQLGVALLRGKKVLE